MAKFKFNLYLMGKEVIVTHILERKVEGDNRFWESKEVEEKRVGWVVGYSYVCNGVYRSGSSSYSYTYDGEYDYDPPYLEVKVKTPCLLVTYWPNQKPIKVPINGFVIWNEDDIDHSLLKPYSSSGYGSGKDRERMLAYYKSFVNDLDRDEKGRFV